MSLTCSLRVFLLLAALPLALACSEDSGAENPSGAGAGGNTTAGAGGGAGSDAAGAGGSAGKGGTSSVPNVCKSDADCQLFEGCGICQAAPKGATAPPSDGGECFATQCQVKKNSGFRCIQGSCQLTFPCSNILPPSCEISCKEGEQLHEQLCTCVPQEQCRVRLCGEKVCGDDQFCERTTVSGGPAGSGSTTTFACKPLPEGCNGVLSCECAQACKEPGASCNDSFGQIDCSVALP